MLLNLAATHAGFGRRPSTAQFGGLFAMTHQAQSSQVGKVAFTSTFDNRHDVVGIPQTLAIDPLETPACKELVTV